MILALGCSSPETMYGFPDLPSFDYIYIYIHFDLQSTL